MLSLRSLAFPLRGEVVAGQVLAPGPGHGPRDRSLSVRLCETSPDGFMVHSFAGDDWRACRDHVRRALGIEPVQRQAPTRAPEPRPKDDQQKARALATAAAYVAEMRPLRGTPGERYLRDARQINTDTIADVLERTRLASGRLLSQRGAFATRQAAWRNYQRDDGGRYRTAERRHCPHLHQREPQDRQGENTRLSDRHGPPVRRRRRARRAVSRRGV
jgi:hypothetical protein